MKKHYFLNTGSFHPRIGQMSAAERQAGRYLRAPDDHPGGTPAPSPAPTPTIAIPPTLPTLDGVPAQFQALYVKDEASGVYKLDDVGALRNTLTHVKTENAQVKGKLSGFKEIGDLGVSAEDIKTWKAEREAAEANRLKEEGDWNALKGQMETNFETERGTFKSRETKLVNTIDKLLVGDQARAVLSDPQIDGNPVLLLPIIRDRVKVTETDDGFSLQVLREDGVPMLNSQNQPATLKDLFLDMKAKPEFAGAFKGVGQSGGGAPGGTAGGGAPGGKKRSEMSNAEKAQYIRQHGQEAYNKIPG